MGNAGNNGQRRTMATLNIRNIDSETVMQVKRAAAARQMTLGQYIARLADLHDAMRQLADDNVHQVARALEALGLQTVRR